MPLNDLNFESLSESDLIQLMNAGVPEGISIEYKQQHYGRKDDDVKEFLKDVSSFANTAGGHLIIGIAETNSIPTALDGVETGSLETEISRYENYCRDCIQPRIVGLKIRHITFASDRAAVILRIPNSLNPPHRVIYKNSNRFYARNSTGAYELSVDELRAIFSGSPSRTDRIRAYRREQINKLLAGDTPVDLTNDSGALVLHIIPYSSISKSKTIDLPRAHLNSQDFAPIDSTSYTPRINMDGFINIRGGSNCYGYTQLFRDGSIEAVKVRIYFDSRGIKTIGSVDFERALVEAVPRYLMGLEKIGVDCPLVVTATLVGVKGAILGISTDQNLYDPPDPIRQDTVFLPEIVIDQYSANDEYVRKLRGIIDVLWNSAGLAGSTNFDANGTWKNPGFR